MNILLEKINSELERLNEATPINVKEYTEDDLINLKVDNNGKKLSNLKPFDKEWDTLYLNVTRRKVSTEQEYYIQFTQTNGDVLYISYNSKGANTKGGLFKKKKAELDIADIWESDTREEGSLFTKDDAQAVINALRDYDQYSKEEGKFALVTGDSSRRSTQLNSESILRAYWTCFYLDEPFTGFSARCDEKFNICRDMIAHAVGTERVLVDNYIWDLCKVIIDKYDGKKGFILDKKSMNYLHDFYVDDYITDDSLENNNTFINYFLFHPDLYKDRSYKDIEEYIKIYKEVNSSRFVYDLPNSNLKTFLGKAPNRILFGKHLLLKVNDELINFINEGTEELSKINYSNFDGLDIRDIAEIKQIIKLCKKNSKTFGKEKDVEEKVIKFRSSNQTSVVKATKVSNEITVENQQVRFISNKKATLVYDYKSVGIDSYEDNNLLINHFESFKDEVKKLFTFSNGELTPKSNFILNIKKLVINEDDEKVVKFDLEIYNGDVEQESDSDEPDLEEPDKEDNTKKNLDAMTLFKWLGDNKLGNSDIESNAGKIKEFLKQFTKESIYKISDDNRFVNSLRRIMKDYISK